MGAFTHDGTENRMRWDRRAADFMEVWYVTLNHSESGAGVWLRYTLTAPTNGEPYCELWAFLFDPEGRNSFAGKQRFDVDRLAAQGRDDGALVRIGESWLSERHLEGEVTSEGRSLAWSLDFDPAGRCFQHLPPGLRKRVEKRVSTVCSPNLSVPFSGTIKVGDRILEFDGESGCQSHRWGRAHSTSWAWAHCSSFDGDDDAVFEGVGAKASLGLLPAPTMTFLYLNLDGQDIAFNEFKWAMRAKSNYVMPSWAFSARNDRYRIVGAARARIANMFQVRYEDPGGSERFCANSEIADLALEVYELSKSGPRHVKSLTSTGNAHVEFGRRLPFPELPVAF